MSLVIVVPPLRHAVAIEKDANVRKIAERACRVWFWTLAATLVDFWLLMFIPRHAYVILAGWAVSLIVMIVAAYMARMVIEHKQFPVVVAEAVAHYKAYPGDFHPGALKLWHESLTGWRRG